MRVERAGGEHLTLGAPADGPASTSPMAALVERRLGNGRGATARAPLTHHEILGLIEPFTRRGRHVDLAASDRLERRLVFKPIVHGAETPGLAGVSEILQLDNPRADFYRLVRILTPETGATAKLTTEGQNPGELLARIETVPPQSQFQTVAEIPIARSYRLDKTADKPRDGASPLRTVLTSAEARLDGLTFTLKADTGTGYPADVALSPQPDDPPDALDNLPDDILATLGWNWSILRRRTTGWTGTLRAPRREPARSRRIGSAMEQAVAHLARTLAEPPLRFHERLTRERWTVVLRRTMPLWVSAILIAAAGGMTFVDIPQDSVFRMMILNLPPVMLVMVFSMREMPRFEIPPLPRPSSASSWFSVRDIGEDRPSQNIDLKQGT